MKKKHRTEAEFFRDHLFVMKLSYLIAKFDNLNVFNLQLQRTNAFIFDVSMKVNDFFVKKELSNKEQTKVTLTINKFDRNS